MIHLPSNEYQKILFWCDMAGGEVGGFGIADATTPERVDVERVFLLKQETTSGDVEYDDDDVAAMIARAGDDAERIRFQWHSHADMGVFFSGTDTENIELLLRASDTWIASLVVNKKHEHKARIDVSNPFRMTLADVELVVENNVDEKTKKTWTSEYEENVTEKKYTYTETSRYDGGTQSKKKKRRKQNRLDDIGFSIPTVSGNRCGRCFGYHATTLECSPDTLLQCESCKVMMRPDESDMLEVGGERIIACDTCVDDMYDDIYRDVYATT